MFVRCARSLERDQQPAVLESKNQFFHSCIYLTEEGILLSTMAPPVGSRISAESLKQPNATPRP